MLSKYHGERRRKTAGFHVSSQRVPELSFELLALLIEYAGQT